MAVASRKQRCKSIDRLHPPLPMTGKSSGPIRRVGWRPLVFWTVLVVFLLGYKLLLEFFHPDVLESTLQELQQFEQQQYDVASSSQRRVLIVGLVGSLQEIFQHSNDGNNVVESIGCLCSSMMEGGEVAVHILYQTDHKTDQDSSSHTGTSSSAGNMFQTLLRQTWELAGCHVTLLSEYDASLLQQYSHTKSEFSKLTRFQRMAKLRSLQRSVILSQTQHSSQQDYNVVINIDFDVMSLPKPSIVHAAIEQVSQAAEIGNTNQQRQQHGMILCANGFETWRLPFVSWVPHLFYDTLAAIDHQGLWYYPIYSVNILNIVTLAQRTLFRRILFFQSTSHDGDSTTKTTTRSTTAANHPSPVLWPMQSCFGGLAMYDWNTWAFPECDYDATQITLDRVPAGDEEADINIHNRDQSSTKWQVSPKYTLTRTEGGDTCEHIVFQQCLRAAATQAAAVEEHNKHGNSNQQLLPPLEVGIKSDLVVEREANILGTRQARGKTLLVVAGVGVACRLLLIVMQGRR